MLNSAEACRGGYPCDLTDLKEAAHCGTYHGPDGSQVKRIAAAIGIQPRTLSDQLNPNEPDQPTVKTLEAIAAFTASHPTITRYFGALQGGLLVYRVPQGTAFDTTTASSVREFGEFLQAVATKGNVLTPSTVRRIRKEGEDALRAIKAALEHIEQLAKAAGAK